MGLFSMLFSAYGQQTSDDIISFLKTHKQFNNSKKSEVGTIAHCLPNTFEFYGIITHPFAIAINLPDSTLTEKQYKNRIPYDFEKAKSAPKEGFTMTMKDDRGREIDLTQYHIQKIVWRSKQTWKLTDWNIVCKTNGIAFNDRTTLNTIWKFFSQNGIPYNLEFPVEGTLDHSRLKRICDIIGQDSNYKKIYVYQTHPHSITDNDTLMLLNTEDVLKYFQNTGFKGYLCASDKSFVLYTDNDLQFSLWGSNKSIADRLKKAIEILPSRLDYKLDQ